MRLAAIVTHPIQYFAPVFRCLSQCPDLKFKVFFGCDHGVTAFEDPTFKVPLRWDCDPISGFDYEFISTGAVSNLKGLSGIYLAIRATQLIRDYKPDAVLIFSYLPTFITASTVLLHLTGHQLLLRAETTDDALIRSSFKDAVRKVVLNNYYRQFSHFFPIGTNSTNHYLRMGVKADDLTMVPYAIDVDFFQQQVDRWLPQREGLRAKNGINPQDQVLMYCGKMFPPKNPLMIPEALSHLSDSEKQGLWLIAVGDGVLRSQFEAMSKAQLGERAIFVGFKNQSELGEYYAMADTLVLPSQSGETWGLVVNEALQFGLRVIASDKVGSSRDLITNTNRGWVFPSGDAEKLAKVISQAVSTPRKVEKTQEDELPHPSHLAKAVIQSLNNYDQSSI